MSAPRYSFSGPVDERIDREGVVQLLPDSIEKNEFCSWLEVEIGRARFMGDAEKRMPARAEELEALRKAKDQLQAAATVLAPEGLPPHATALLKDALYRPAGPGFEYLRESVAANLRTLVVAIEIATTTIAAKPSRAGRKTPQARDDLLKKIVAKMTDGGLAAATARQLAKEVLALHNIHTPDDDRSIRRAAARGSKSP